MRASIQKISLVLVAIMLVGIVLAGLVFVKAFDAWQLAQRAGNEAAAVQNLKTIATVELQYFYSHHRTFGTLEQLVKEQMLSSKFAGNPEKVTVDGYVFTLKLTPEPQAFVITAAPESALTGSKHFYFDSVSREIHVNSEKPAGPSDPILDK
jgi:type II secretory pathway pseudopilin PulG